MSGRGLASEYLDVLGNRRLLGAGDAHWQALTEQSLADGLLDAALLARYETAVRPQELRWEAWTRSQLDKVGSAIDQLEGWPRGLEIASISARSPSDVGWATSISGFLI